MLNILRKGKKERRGRKVRGDNKASKIPDYLHTCKKLSALTNSLFQNRKCLNVAVPITAVITEWEKRHISTCNTGTFTQ